jgi:peptidoglycan/xylan/chitin deacetylase (PgdA/CDA1 family)
MSGKVINLIKILLLASAVLAALFFLYPNITKSDEASQNIMLSPAEVQRDYLLLAAQSSDFEAQTIAFAQSERAQPSFCDVATYEAAKHILMRPTKITYEKFETDLPYFSLTFDDCPIGYIEEILDVLKEYEMRGTFFVIGSYAATYPEITQRIVDDGHTIANHTFTHKTITEITDWDFTKEVQNTQYVVSKITGKRTTLFRPPGGRIETRQIRRLAELGYTIALWSVDSLDWQHSEGAIERAKAAGPGDIVLFHTKSVTGEDMRELLEYYKAEGLTSVPVEELAALSYASQNGMAALSERGFDFEQPSR